MEKSALNFNWKEYVTLNPYSSVPHNPDDALKYWLANPHQANSYSSVEVLIHAPWKTGSSALYASFMKSDYVCSLMHDNPSNKDLGKITDIINCPRANKLLVVCTYREPIGQYISAFFENTAYDKEHVDTHDVKWYEDTVLAYLNHMSSKKVLPTNLYTEDRRENFDHINILDLPFDREAGYAKISTNKIDILVLRFDQIKQWESIIRQHTRFTNFRMVPTNISANKPAGHIYKEIVDNIVIPKNILDEFYEKEDVNMKHFYSQEEIDAIKAKWYSRLD